MTSNILRDRNKDYKKINRIGKIDFINNHDFDDENNDSFKNTVNEESYSINPILDYWRPINGHFTQKLKSVDTPSNVPLSELVGTNIDASNLQTSSSQKGSLKTFTLIKLSNMDLDDDDDADAPLIEDCPPLILQTAKSKSFSIHTVSRLNNITSQSTKDMNSVISNDENLLNSHSVDEVMQSNSNLEELTTLVEPIPNNVSTDSIENEEIFNDNSITISHHENDVKLQKEVKEYKKLTFYQLLDVLKPLDTQLVQEKRQLRELLKDLETKKTKLIETLLEAEINLENHNKAVSTQRTDYQYSLNILEKEKKTLSREMNRKHSKDNIIDSSNDTLKTKNIQTRLAEIEEERKKLLYELKNLEFQNKIKEETLNGQMKSAKVELNGFIDNIYVDTNLQLFINQFDYTIKIIEKIEGLMAIFTGLIYSYII